jgi:uncharacterized repeat protein (TIGR03803 family)
MLKINRMIMRSALALIASNSVSHAELPVRAFADFPKTANPGALIHGRDGFLYGAIRSNEEKNGGLIYRVEPGGTFEVLHQFPLIGDIPSTNNGGNSPSEHLVLAEDGCLYGLADNGGLHGRGVLYRIEPNGKFTVVADLNPDTLPPGTVEGPWFSYNGRCFMEGPDHAFYLSQDPSGAVVRIGRDGMMSVAGTTGPADRILRDPAQPFHMIAVKYLGGFWSQNTNGMQIRRFSLVTGGTVGEDIIGPAFAPEFSDFPQPVQWTAQGLLVTAQWNGGGPQGESDRLFRVNLDGSMVMLTDFSYENGSLPPPVVNAPYFGPGDFRAKDDGTILYGTGAAQAGYLGGGGRTLIELKPDGQFRTICGFGLYTLLLSAEGTGQTLFGASYGDEVYVPHNGSGYSWDWMEVTNAANFDKIRQPGKSGMFVQISLDGAPLSTPPIAEIDMLVTKGATELTISPTANDYDPDGGTIQLLGAGPASQGEVVVTSAIDGSSKVIFTPADTRKSAIIPYQIADSGDAPSTGTILVRGDYSGNFVDPDLLINGKPFSISLTQWGKFSGDISASNGAPVKMSGEMDWYDVGLASRLLSPGNVVSLSVELVSEEGLPLALKYRIRQSDGAEITGQATKVH